MIDERNPNLDESVDEEAQQTETSNTNDEEKLEGDRSVPPLGQDGDIKGKIAAFAAIVVGGAFVLFMFTSQANKKAPPPPSYTDNEEIEFRSSNPGNPFIQSTFEEERQPLSVASEDKPPVDIDALLALQKEQIRQQEKARKELEKRIKSEQVVYDRKTRSNRQTTPEQDAVNSRRQALLNHVDQLTANLKSGQYASPVSMNADTGVMDTNGSQDPNTTFLEAASVKKPETYYAHRIADADWTVTQGTMIGAVVENAINSDLPGPIRAIVTEDIYSLSQKQVLIPRGSHLIGEYKSQLGRGQARIFVVWTRLIRSDGVTVQLGSLGTDSLGRSGMTGDVDTHFWERFGSSIVLSIIDGIIEVAVENAKDDENGDLIIGSAGTDLENAASIALRDAIGRRPTVTIPQGERIKVFLGRDLNFRTAQ